MSKWQKEELAYLEKLANTLPLQLITNKINNWNKGKGNNVERTMTAVKVKLKRLGYGTTPTENYLSGHEWTRQLGLKSYRVQGWVRHLGLKSIKISRNKRAISILAMKEFATQKPHLFSAINPDILIYYFGEDLTNVILNAKDKCPDFLNQKKPIQRKDNGVIYPSIREASMKLNMNKTSVRYQAKHNGWLQFTDSKV